MSGRKAVDLRALGLRVVVCAICGQEATCIGQYDDATAPAPACDDCCGHACEDGHCDPLDECAPEVVAAFSAVPR
jgi:hypothetical protein